MLRLSEWKAAQGIIQAVQKSYRSTQYPPNKEDSTRDEVTAPGLVEIMDPQTGQPLLVYPDEKPYTPSADNNSYSPNRTS